MCNQVAHFAVLMDVGIFSPVCLQTALKGDPILWQILYFSGLILMKPFNCLLFNEIYLKNSIAFITELLVPFYENYLWPGWWKMTENGTQ